MPHDATSSTARAAALEYARALWPMLPLDASLTALEHNPSCDADEIVRWWARFPEAQPGVVLGRPLGTSRQHLVALIDHCSKESTSYLQARGAYDALGMGHLSKFGGARAWLFASPEPMVSRELAPGLEVVGSGVIPLPPSYDTRGQWAWRKGSFRPEQPLAPAPHWLRIAEAEPARSTGEPLVSAEWVDDIARNKAGGVVASLGNAALILRCDARYAGRLAYNEMTLGISLDGATLDDASVAGMRETLERRYGAQFADTTLRDALLVVAGKRRFHPVRSYLGALKWDGVARIDALIGGAVPVSTSVDLARKMVRSFLVSAVARAMCPGEKVDTCLVLLGAQGTFKSTFFRTLAGSWFSDSYIDPTNKDALQQIAAAWIYELGEVDSITSRKHASDLKRFMSSATDAFRPPYERSVRVVLRSGVMVGSTNRERFLTDDTGNRRWWVVRVDGPIDIAALAAQRDQIWAEAVAAWRRQERWHLSAVEETARESDAEQYQEQDAWRQLVIRYFQQRIRARDLRGDYTCSEIGTDVMKLERKELGKHTEMRIGAVLASLGLERRKVRIKRDGQTLPPTWTWVFLDTKPDWILTDDPEEEHDFDEPSN